MMNLRERVEVARNGSNTIIKKGIYIYGNIILILNIIILIITFNKHCDKPLKYILIIETFKRIISLIIIPILLKIFLLLSNNIQLSFDIYNERIIPRNIESLLLLLININLKLLHLIWIIVFILINIYLYNCKNCDKLLKNYMYMHVISMYLMISLVLFTSCIWICYIGYLAYKTRDPSMSYWQTFYTLYHSMGINNENTSTNYEFSEQLGTPTNIINGLQTKIYKSSTDNNNNNSESSNNDNNNILLFNDNNINDDVIEINNINDNISRTININNPHNIIMDTNNNSNSIINSHLILSRNNTHSTDKSSTEILNSIPIIPTSNNVIESKIDEQLILNPSIFTDNILTNYDNSSQFLTIDIQSNNEHSNDIENSTNNNITNNNSNNNNNNNSVFNGNFDDKCSICLCYFENNDIIVILPCKHEYHRECIINWLKRRKTCPYCRHDITSGNENIN